jgi:7-cyano-7-deazaguanine synthase
MSLTPKDDAAKALVLLSGGQDSAVCLAWALTRYGHVETLGFAYGQRHSVELECRPKLREAIAAGFPGWRPRLGPDHVLDLSILGQVSDTALTSDAEITGRRWPTGAASATSWAACARRTIPAIPIAATRRSKR